MRRREQGAAGASGTLSAHGSHDVPSKGDTSFAAPAVRFLSPVTPSTVELPIGRHVKWMVLRGNGGVLAVYLCAGLELRRLGAAESAQHD